MDQGHLKTSTRRPMIPSAMPPQLDYAGNDGLAFLAALAQDHRPTATLLLTGQRSFVGQSFAGDVEVRPDVAFTSGVK